MGHPHSEHRSTSRKSVACAVLTVSDTRTQDTDEGGRLLREGLAAAGHAIAAYAIVKDEPSQVTEAVRGFVAAGAQAVILTGGTGITSRDGTYEAVSALLQKTLPGFGEIFRFLSFQEIGAAAVMSRALAGLMGRTVVISLPGSPSACRLALEKLILPELPHMVREASR